MSQAQLPFPPPREDLNLDMEHLLQCGLYTMLPEPFQQATQEQTHLLAYLHLVPIGEVGIPTYYPELSRNLRSLKTRNLIYPIPDGAFTHIYSDPTGKGGRDHSIAVEPSLSVDVDTLMMDVEYKLLDMVEEIGSAETDEKKGQIILDCVDRVCDVKNGTKSKWKWFGKKRRDKIQVTPLELAGIKYRILRDKIGLGVLQPLLADKYVEDISCSGLGHIFVEHKIFKSLQSSLVFQTHSQLDDFVVWLGERVKKPVTARDPIVDATLPDGSRINIVYGRDVSKRGSNFTIRRFAETPYSILELVEFGTMDYVMAAYLSLVIEEGMNLFVSGETASGKTTTLNAITTFILPDSKIVSIEDTPELQVPHKNWVREVSKGKKQSEAERGSEVTMFELLRACLRQRPNFIIIGEIRGAEGAIAFQAMQTGHAVMSTFHAASVQKLIQRITGNPIDVPKTYLDNLNVVIIQSTVRLADGSMARRVLSINEIVGYDSVSNSFSFIEVFRWNPATDVFEFPGDMNSYLLEQKIAVKRGFPPSEKRKIYSILGRRARILERLHKEKGITNFYDLLGVLAEAQTLGVF